MSAMDVRENWIFRSEDIGTTTIFPLNPPSNIKIDTGSNNKSLHVSFYNIGVKLYGSFRQKLACLYENIYLSPFHGVCVAHINILNSNLVLV